VIAAPRALGAVLAGAALLAGAPAASAASRTATLEGWDDSVAAFSGRAVIVAEAAAVRVDPRNVPGAPAGAAPFVYYRHETARLGLNPARTRFAGDPVTLVSVRESIAGMGPGLLSPAATRGFVVVPSGRLLAPPVIWCCQRDVEVVLESDGRPDAPVALAAAEDGPVVRFLLAFPDGHRELVSSSPASPGARASRTVAAPAGPGLVALAPGLLAQVDPAAPALLAVSAVDASGTVAAPATVALPGRAIRIWAARGLVAAAVRAGGRVRLVRWSGGGRARTVWSGATVPRVSVGGGAVAVGERRRVLASRRGPLRQVARTRGPVAAVAVDGRRVAWLERLTRRGARVTVARLGSTP
jgi:hypothetical protein